MKYRVDPTLSKRAYVQLYEALREDIVEGSFPYGARLPSKRLLSEEVGISVVTAEHAYALLCEEGYAQARERSGYFVSFRKEDGFLHPEVLSAVRPFPAEKREEASQFPFSAYAKATRKVLLDQGERILVKSPGKGDESFRRALCGYLARSRGIYVLPDQIVVGSGAEYLYGLILLLLGKEKKFALEDPSYEKIWQVYRAQGASCEYLPLTSCGIESRALKESGADVLHLTPYRSYPSGVTATASKKREYLRWAERDGRYLVEDDFESEFTLSRKPEDTLFAMTKRENVIYVNTFSKTVSPSIRVGYMVLPRRLLPAFEEKVGFYSCTVPLLEQMILKELIAGGDFERHINRVRRALRREKENV